MEESSRKDEPFATDGGELSGEELERMYQQALEAMEAVEQEVEETLGENGLAAGASTAESEPTAGRQEQTVPPPQQPGSEEPHAQPNGLSRAHGEAAGPAAWQIIEAALFVGGASLTTKKLCWLLDIEPDADRIADLIERLNQHYAEQNRPYEVQRGEGGYRLALKPTFERVRSRVYGRGPKEVTLSQKALEILALVAYRQPVTKSDIEACGKEKPEATLRSLLRRQLIAIQRGEDVRYVTTGRFLDLLGLGELSELPRPETLRFK